MTQRCEYELTDKQFGALVIRLHEARAMPVMMIGEHAPSSPQEVANSEWCQLGREMGFDGMSVQPAPGKSERFFTAIPVPVPFPGRGRINLVFDGPPGPEGPCFIEAEDAFGASVNVGEWKQEGDRWLLVLP